MRKTMTDAAVAKLRPGSKTYHHPDPELRGHYVRVLPTGTKSFAAVARNPVTRKQEWATIGAADTLSIAEARRRAQTALARIRAGQAAFEPPVQSFEAVARDWLKRHVEKNRLRSAKQITRLLELHVFDFWKGRPFESIKRSDVTALLDDVEDDHSPRQADAVLTVVRAIMFWYGTRHDGYQPPVIRGMRRQNPKEQVRERVLTDDKLRAIWQTAEGNGTFGAFVRMALLTAQRRAKIMTMRWNDISEDGEWTIPQAKREKDSAKSLRLPQIAREIIAAQPRLGDNLYVFASGRSEGPINGFSKSKRAFDAKLSGVAAWTIHDLRRTARSLLSPAGVSSEHAERVMGHAIGGVEGVYDRHAYRDEKAEALRKLAALIDAIVHPRANVVAIKGAKRR